MGEAALNQFSQELGDTFPSPLLRGASLRDADAVGARIPAGATRATEATGREAVAVTETSVAALLADGARRRSRRAVDAGGVLDFKVKVERAAKVSVCERWLSNCSNRSREGFGGMLRTRTLTLRGSMSGDVS